MFIYILHISSRIKTGSLDYIAFFVKLHSMLVCVEDHETSICKLSKLVWALQEF